MSNDEIFKHWLESADEDRKAAEILFASNHFHWCLFLWHLTLEKTFKAILTKKDKEIPFTHNLLQLAKIAQTELTAASEKELKEITTFNLEARYDDYRLSFYKKATKTYTEKWVKTCSQWLADLEKYL